MTKLLVGIIIGIVMSADAFMVGFCVWYERQHPEVHKTSYFPATRNG